jgi:hypothetical protein
MINPTQCLQRANLKERTYKYVLSESKVMSHTLVEATRWLLPSRKYVLVDDSRICRPTALQSLPTRNPALQRKPPTFFAVVDPQTLEPTK